jgi:hypothetical protein
MNGARFFKFHPGIEYGMFINPQYLCFYLKKSLNYIFNKNLQGGTFAFEHLYLQILDSHLPYQVF